MIKKLLWLAGFLCITTGCASHVDSTHHKSVNKNSKISELLLRHKGSWQGDLKSYSTANTILITDGKEEGYREGVIDTNTAVMLLNCNSSPEIWFSSNGEDYYKIYENYHINYHNGNFIMSIIENDEGWVESQSYSFVFLNEDSGKVQRSRMVNNYELERDDSHRSFGFLGYGDLQKVSDDCEIFNSSPES